MLFVAAFYLLVNFLAHADGTNTQPGDWHLHCATQGIPQHGTAILDFDGTLSLSNEGMKNKFKFKTPLTLTSRDGKLNKQFGLDELMVCAWDSTTVIHTDSSCEGRVRNDDTLVMFIPASPSHPVIGSMQIQNLTSEDIRNGSAPQYGTILCD